MIAAPKVEYVLNVMNGLGMELNCWTDIGCGTGEILYYLQEKGYKGFGIESDDREIRFALERNLRIVKGYVSAALPDEEIENVLSNSTVVSFFNVLEHMEIPNEFIDYIWEHTQPGCILVFEVPRFPSLATFSNITQPSKVYRHLVPPIHLQIFTERSIRLLLEGKFELISKWEFGQGIFDLVTNAALCADKLDMGLYHQILDISNPLQLIVDQNGLADQMIFVAKRI